jgi:hypothetical protein
VAVVSREACKPLLGATLRTPPAGLATIEPMVGNLRFLDLVGPAARGG